MYRDATIPKSVFEANHEKLTGAILNPHSRQGLCNLLRAPVLADAVKRALDHVYLQPSFNASTWGKKLVKGRFFQLAADLIDEMLTQCDLLKGDAVDVTSKSFQLSSQACSWKQLEISTRKKDHAWQSLPGGACGALKRVKARPVNFVSFLNPDGTDGWTFPHTVLLPLVLTSDTVYGELKLMYSLAQHVVKIIAGEESLKAYTTNIPHTSDHDHPVGIISILIQPRMKGKPSNIPHKIIQDIWANRELLLSELRHYAIDEAPTATASKYSALLQGSQPWRDIIAVLKLAKLPGGVNIPKAPIPKPGSKAEAVLEAIRRKRSAGGSPRDSTMTTTMPDCQPSTSSDRDNPPSLAGLSEQARSPSLVFEGSPEGNPPTQQSSSRRSRTVSNPHVSKRQKVTEASTPGSEEEDMSQETPLGEEDNYSDTTITVVNTNKQLLNNGKVYALRCHYTVQQQLEELHAHVLEMETQHVRALGQLLSILQAAKDQEYFGRVIQTLAGNAERYVQRAAKASQAVEAASKDWDSEDEGES